MVKNLARYLYRAKVLISEIAGSCFCEPRLLETSSGFTTALNLDYIITSIGKSQGCIWRHYLPKQLTFNSAARPKYFVALQFAPCKKITIFTVSCHCIFGNCQS